jgi:hypothetical protein
MTIITTEHMLLVPCMPLNSIEHDCGLCYEITPLEDIDHLKSSSQWRRQTSKEAK